MLSGFKSHITSFSDKINRQKLSLTSGITVVATSLLNYFLDKSVFKCPQKLHQIYGCAFLIGPGVLLAILTLLCSSRLSKVFTGFCKRDQDVPDDAFCGKRRQSWRFIIKNLSIAFMIATLACFSWIIVSLLTTDAYVCIKVGPTDKNKKAEYETFSTQSKVAGMVILVICLSFALAINITVKCWFSEIPEKKLPSMRRYDKMEATAANKELQSLMEKSADARGKEMVQKLLRQINAMPSENYQGGEVNNAKEILSREDVENLRRFLALRYPRLDGEDQVYCRQNEIPENFYFDKLDGGPPVNLTSPA